MARNASLRPRPLLSLSDERIWVLARTNRADQAERDRPTLIRTAGRLHQDRHAGLARDDAIGGARAFQARVVVQRS